MIALDTWMMPITELPQPDPVELANGRPALIRPIRPDDAPALQAFHARLSDDSIYLRWLSAHPTLSDAEAQTLANVDYAQRMAFVAVAPQPAGGPEAGDAGPELERIIGVARYGVVDPAVPYEAEAAVVVEDSYQHRGLGTHLLRHLIDYARAHGVRTWLAEVNAENSRMMKFIRRGGQAVTKSLEGGTWQVRIDITGIDTTPNP